MDWVVDDKSRIPNKNTLNQPVLIVLTGLSGDRDNPYFTDVITEAKKLGYKCVLLGYRGVFGMKLTSRRLYDAAQVSDVSKLLNTTTKSTVRKTV